MKNADSEVIVKLMEIAKLKKDVIKLMLPEQTYKHLEVIGNEVKAMMMEAICESNQGAKSHTSEHQTSVKKVNID